MTTVSFIGSGMIGGTVARLSVAAGHHVVLSNSRGPETLKDLVEELGPLAAAATGKEATGHGAFCALPEVGSAPVCIEYPVFRNPDNCGDAVEPAL